MFRTIQIATLCLTAALAVESAAQGYVFEIDSSPYTLLGAGRTPVFDGSTGTHDNQSFDVFLPFNFQLFGVSENILRISTNGYVTFRPETGTYSSNEPIPATRAPNSMICAWWDHLVVAGNGVADLVSYEIQGAPGSRVVVVEWRSVSNQGDTATDYSFANFQIALHEGTNEIEMRYGTIGVVGTVADYSATVGIENGAGTEAIVPYCEIPNLDRSDWPGSGTVIRYTPASPAYSVSICDLAYQHLGSSRVALYRGDIAPADDASVDIPLAFDLDIMGETHSNVRVSTNGYLTFSPAAGNRPANRVLPTTEVGGIVIAPWWDDLKVAAYGTVDEISYDILGPAGAYVAVVEWRSISRFHDSASDHNFLYFQVRMYEEDDRIEFHYGSSGVIGTPASDFTATVGIQNAAATEAITPLAGDLLSRDRFPSGKVIRFDPIVTPYVCGDCNSSGAGPDILDSLLGAQIAVGAAIADPTQTLACNVDGDADVDILDALQMAQAAAGFSVTLSCP